MCDYDNCDDYDAYDRDDPKHPDWADAQIDRADLERKRAKEELCYIKPDSSSDPR